MNCVILVAVLVLAFLDGYSCQNIKYSAKYVPDTISKSDKESENLIKGEIENVLIEGSRGNATNDKIKVENVRYEFESGVDGNEKLDSPPVSTWVDHWALVPTVATFSLKTGIPMSSRDLREISEDPRGKGGGGFKVKKKYQKYLLPLLLAYKLKFFTLIPVMIGGLLLLVGATGLAGFFFALFAAVMGLKSGGHGGH